MNGTARYRRTCTLLSIALVFGSLMSCAKAAPRMVPTIRETASQWNAAVDRSIPDADRAGRVKQLGLQLIELQDSLSSDIAVLNSKTVDLNANYGATKDETRQLLAVFFEKRNAADEHRKLALKGLSAVNDDIKKLNDQLSKDLGRMEELIKDYDSKPEDFDRLFASVLEKRLELVDRIWDDRRSMLQNIKPDEWQAIMAGARAAMEKETTRKT